MSRADPQQAVLHIVLGLKQLDACVLPAAGGGVPNLGPWPVAETSLQAVLAACEPLVLAGEAAQAQGQGVGRVRVLVADPWLMSHRLPWSEALEREASAQAYARGQLQAAGCEIEPDDLLCLEAGRYGQPCLVFAFPVALMAALSRVAARWGGVLDAVLPLSVAAWGLAQAAREGTRNSPLVVRVPGCLLVMQGQDRLTDVTVRVKAAGFDPDEAPADAVHAQWRRMGLRDPELERAGALRGLNLCADSWVWPAMPLPLATLLPPALDGASPLLGLSQAATLQHSAINPVPSTGGRPSGFRLQAVGVVVLLLASALLGAKAWAHWRTAHDLAQQQSTQREASARQRATAGQATVRAEDPTRVRAVNSAIRELNMPVSPLLRALQAPRDMRVLLLSVDMSAAGDPGQGGGTVKVVAEASTGSEMARYVSHIAGRKPIQTAYLVRHEVQEAAPERPYRFTVEAQWAR